MSSFSFTATTLAGFEDILAQEIVENGGEDIRKYRRAVSFRGGISLMYKMNLNLRTAIRVLRKLTVIRINQENDFYKGVYLIPWETYFTNDKTIAVKATVNSKFFDNSLFVALKTKDAIVDRFRDKTGRRPDVDINQPEILIHVHIHNQMADISLDSSGDPLFKRGYREQAVLAPLNEVLAAGMILMTGWKGDSDFIDPMCGSGTLSIEAAMIAKGIPPGIHRRGFSFQNWIDYDEPLFHRVLEGLMVSRDFTHKIIASDISSEAVSICRKNISKALLDDIIEVETQDFFESSPESIDGTVIINPPYGERLKENKIRDFYNRMGDHLKSNYKGYKAWILTTNEKAAQGIGLHPDKKIQLFNGKLPCKYLKFDIFEGKRKDYLKEN